MQVLAQDRVKSDKEPEATDLRCVLDYDLCQVSGVGVTFFFSFFVDKVVELVGGGAVINRAYPV